MLERWNDDRMDALDAKVDALDVKVNGMDVRLARVEVRIAEGFKRTDAELLELRREMKAGFEKLDDRFGRMQWYWLGAALTIIVALIGTPHL